MLAEGLPARLSGRCSSLRRDAPLHSYLCVLVGRASDGDSGRASCAYNGQIKIRSVAHDQSNLRSDDDKVHGLLSDQAALCFWLGWLINVLHFVVLRGSRLRNEICELAASC